MTSATNEQATPTISAIGWISAMFKEPHHGQVAPRLPAASAVKADMAAGVGQKRRKRRVGRPIIAPIERAGNPGIVERGHHQGGNADAGHEPGRPAALVVVLGTGETVPWRDEDVVV